MKTTVTQSPPKAFVVPLNKLIVPPDRGRKKFTNILELGESIQRIGMIHPIVVTPSKAKPGYYDIVAGERRYRGALSIALPEVLVVLREEASSTIAEIEYEENVNRSDISWPEQCSILAKMKAALIAEGVTNAQERIAEITNRSTADVSLKINANKQLTENPELKKHTNLPFTAFTKKVKQLEEAQRIGRLVEQGQIQLTTELRHGDCTKLITTLPAESVDLLLTDPPYGIERLEALRESPGTTTTRFSGYGLMSEHHNQTLAQVLATFRTLAPELGRVLVPGAHCYIFCAAQFSGYILEALEPYLEFQPPMLIWDKGRTTTPGFGYNYLSKTEFIIHAHKLPRSRRLNESMANVLECPEVPKNLRMYPTEKPMPLLQVLIKQSTVPGQLVLDPFAGSASTLVAARETGRRAIGFEINQESYLRAQNRLTSQDL